MTLNFKQISFWGKNCPNFLGIKEHGNRLALDLTIETCEVFNCFSERDSLNIFADKTILLTQMTYNFSSEDYEERSINDFTENQEVIEALDKWFKENPIYRCSQFPYELSTEKDSWSEKNFKLDSFEKVIKFLKEQ